MSRSPDETPPELEQERNDQGESPSTRANRLGGLAGMNLVPSPMLHIPDIAAGRSVLGQSISNSLASAELFKFLPKHMGFIEQFGPVIPALSIFSQVTLGDSMFSANMAAISAGLGVRKFVSAANLIPASTMPAPISGQLRNLVDISGIFERHSALLSDLRPSLEIARPVSLATRAWQDAVRVATPDPIGTQIERLTIAGRGTGWAVQAGFALTETDDARVSDIEAEAVVVLGPAAAGADLRAQLNAVDPSLGERLDGAWERIHQGGPHASSQAAHSLMETVDWTLRLLAPDEAVLEWHKAESRPAKELHADRPTRVLRLRYIVRNCPEKNSTLNLYVKSIQELTGVLQGPKHGLHAPSVRALTSVALSVEGFLSFLLVD